MKPVTWNECYDDGWQGFITKESFAHPAKYSRGLIERIFDHMLERGWLHKNDVVGDCFGGIATGGIVAAYRGLRWVGVELEGRFHSLALDNFLLHSSKWCHCENQNAQVYSMWLRLREEHRRNKPQTTAENGSVLRDGMQEQLPLQGKEIVRGSPKEPDGPHPLEQGSSMVGPNEEKTIATGDGWEPGDGKEWQLGRRQICEPERLRGNSNERKAKIGTRSLDGDAPREKDESRRGSSPSQRNKNRQPSPEPSGDDNKRTHAASQHWSDEPEKQSKTCPSCGCLRVPLPVIIQGDSRKFAQIVGEIVGVVTSPPYADTTNGNDKCGIDWDKAAPTKKTSGRHQAPGASASAEYGTAPGQIGRLKSGSVDAVVSSPPFLATEGGCKPKMGGVIDGSMMQRHNATADTRYGQEDAQIGNLKAGSIDAVVSSPPFRDARSDTTKAGATKGGGPCAERLHSVQAGTTYGKSDGQIDNLATGDVHAVVTSPPWEKNCEGDIKRHKVNFLPDNGKGHYASPAAKERAMQKAEQKVYGETEGQIGQEAKETYWAAMRDVYAQCFLAIKPGGYIAVVVKSYVKNKQIVDLPADTARLLEHCGFVMVEIVHAMLTKETQHNDLFDGSTTTKVSRKSFFRRLAESKGSPKIDYEVVLFAMKPLCP